MFSTMMGGVMGWQRLICRDIRGLWHLSWRPKLLVMLNTPKNARRLEGDLREKETAPSKYAFDGAVYAFGRLRMRCQTTRT